MDLIFTKFQYLIQIASQFLFIVGPVQFAGVLLL